MKLPTVCFGPVCNNLIHDERTCGEEEILPFFLSQGSRIEMSASSRTLIVVVFSITSLDVLALCPSTEVQPGFLFSCELRRDDIFSAVDVAKGKSLVIRGGAPYSADFKERGTL